MSALELLQWQNLFFALPFVGALLYVLLMALSGVGADHDIDHDVEVDHDVEHGGIEHDHELEPSMLMRALSVLGVGRVPISIIVTSLCFTWGTSGWIMNMILHNVFPAGIYVWISLVVAFFSSIIFTRLIAIGMSKIMPSTTSFGVKHRDLVGRIAESDTEISDTFGQASLRDDSGVLMRVSCRVKKGADPIPRNTQVVLMYYDKANETFLVNSELPIELPKE